LILTCAEISSESETPTVNILSYRNNQLGLEGQEDAELLESLRKRIDYLRGLKHLIHAHTDESFLLDFSDFKLVAPLKRSLTVTFEPKVLKKIISFLEIEETIQLRAVNKLLKGLSEEYIKDLTELSIYFYETTKVNLTSFILISSSSTNISIRRSLSSMNLDYSLRAISS
jgi:hypothetical protein